MNAKSTAFVIGNNRIVALGDSGHRRRSRARAESDVPGIHVGVVSDDAGSVKGLRQEREALLVADREAVRRRFAGIDRLEELEHVWVRDALVWYVVRRGS